MEENNPNEQGGQPQQSSSGYGKRPVWQWALLYLVIGGLLYWAIYYFFLKPDDTSGGLYGGASGTVETGTDTGDGSSLYDF